MEEYVHTHSSIATSVLTLVCSQSSQQCWHIVSQIHISLCLVVHAYFRGYPSLYLLFCAEQLNSSNYTLLNAGVYGRGSSVQSRHS